MGPEHIAQGLAFRRHGGRVFAAAGGPQPRWAFPPSRRVHALGIAGTQSSGLMAAQFGAMVKRMHAGRASQSGLYGALLAARALPASSMCSKTRMAVSAASMSRGSTDRFDLSKLTSGAGYAV